MIYTSINKNFSIEDSNYLSIHGAGAFSIEAEDSEVNTIGCTFINCSSTMYGGGMKLFALNISVTFCCFAKCVSVDRGSCVFTLSDNMNVLTHSSAYRTKSSLGSFYLKCGGLSVGSVNDSESTATQNAGVYPVLPKEGSVLMYVGFHRLYGKYCLGFSEKSSNGRYTKYVVTECQSCEAVFKLFASDVEVEDVYLWRVPSILRDFVSPGYKLLIKNLYSDSQFTFGIETASISNSFGLGDVPKSGVTFCNFFISCSLEFRYHQQLRLGKWMAISLLPTMK